MYTIFCTINCVEQLTFSKTFVYQLQFEQLIFFCLKVKLLEIHVRQMIFDFWAVDKKSDICSNGVEQMKNRVEQIFRANEFWADDHDPNRLLSRQILGIVLFLIPMTDKKPLFDWPHSQKYGRNIVWKMSPKITF